MVKDEKQVRVWVDGCFDLNHYGHYNALRQSRELGDYLVVGIHNDADITKHKGPPVMSEEERYEAVLACKWVDEIVKDAPYVTTIETLDKYDCDFCAHGEDITTDENGVDCYQQVKNVGRYKTIKRTNGISTTDLVGKMLLMTKSDHNSNKLNDKDVITKMQTEHNEKKTPSVSCFFPSTRTIALFSQGTKSPKDSDKIIYIDGAFDLFHIGHIKALKQAKEQGDYLIVGIHDDNVVHDKKGPMLPLLSLQERTLSVLSCRYVDEVIVGAPWIPTKKMIELLKIDLVVRGSTSDYNSKDEDLSEKDIKKQEEEEDSYKEAKELGKFKLLKSETKTTTATIVQRIIANRNKFLERNARKNKKEIAAKKYLEEQQQKQDA